MRTTPRTRQPDATASETSAVEDVLQCVETGRERESITLSSGRRYALEAGRESDRIVVTSASGRVLLRVAIGEDGPLLSFESAAITLSAKNKLALVAPEIDIEADTLRTRAVERSEHVTGDRHTLVSGEERVEAAAVAIQASDRGVRVRAMERIELDGDHIGLNDLPCPEPFDWSRLHQEMS